jgi:aryl-alcohol dehydrogenase-like predicted oxidoreductase
MQGKGWVKAMDYVMLGNSGLTVSRLALGAMTFTGGNRSMASINKVDQKLADSMIGCARDAGVNFFDTADVYDRGESEVVLGRALKGCCRNEVVIATKVGLRTGRALTQAGLSRRHILQSIDDSLKRLDTDWIDVYLAHKYDPLTPLEETLAAFDAAVCSGKVRYIAFSNWPAWAAAAALEMQRTHHWAPFSHGQMHYSLLGRDIERDMVPMMQRYRLGLTVWSPLAFGFLSGKFTRESLKSDGTRFAENDLLPFDKEQGFRLVEKIRSMAERYAATIPQVALAWLLGKEPVSSILLGATKLSQLSENLAAIKLRLSAEDMAALDEATPLPPVYPYWFINTFQDRPLQQALSGGK